MMAGVKWLKRASAFAVLLNLAAIAGHYYLIHEFAEGVTRPSGTSAPITGITVDGNTIADSSAPCHVIRYTSIRCPWCRRDQPSWDSFDQILRNSGCDSTSLGPSGEDLPRKVDSLPNRRFLVAVPAVFAQKIDLTATPTTVVLDREWNIVWSHVGLLGANDAGTAVAALGLQ